VLVPLSRRTPEPHRRTERGRAGRSRSGSQPGDRRRRTGHDEATGRSGKRASSSTPVPLTACGAPVLCGTGIGSVTGAASGCDSRGHSAFSPNRTFRVSARYPAAGGESDRRSRCRAWNASTPSITSSVSGSGTAAWWTDGHAPSPAARRSAARPGRGPSGTPPNGEDREGTSSIPGRRWPGRTSAGTRRSSAPGTPPQRPPQRLIPAGRHQAVRLRPQPHERVRGGGQLLQAPGPLCGSP